MPQEIERKFLVHKILWEVLKKPKGVLYRQGYILTDPTKTIRVRLAGNQGFLTIKGQSIGAVRAEYEYKIPASEAQELLDNFTVSELSKIRHKVKYREKLWEIDVFLGKNEGLIVAEIELQSEDETFDLPDWIDKEVTDDKRYFNSNLTLKPYKEW